jgi:hypothetical protein
MQSGKLFENLSAAQQSAFMAWKSAYFGEFPFCRRFARFYSSLFSLRGWLPRNERI